jgi:Ca-activated chloride channel family protein
MTFADPYFLLLFIVVPVLAYVYYRKHWIQTGAVRFSSVTVLNRLRPSPKQQLRHILFILRLAALTLAIIAFARPQSSYKEEEVETEGIDIILAMDISSSMNTMDFNPLNRLEAAKVVAADFIKGRKNDRIGLVVFSGRSYTQCPLTLDYGILLTFLKQINIGMIEDGTAIGMAIATASNRLRESKAKSKVIILLTDGQNNRGELDPPTAAQIAQALNIKIYTIGVGSQGVAMYPVDDPVFGRRMVPVQVNIDEETLQNIADITGGKYFRATDEKKLKGIFEEISRMEKTKIELKAYTRYAELFEWFALPALIILLLEVILTNTIFRKIP